MLRPLSTDQERDVCATPDQPICIDKLGTIQKDESHAQEMEKRLAAELRKRYPGCRVVVMVLHYFFSGKDLRYKEELGLEVYYFLQFGEEIGFMLSNQVSRERHLRELALILNVDVDEARLAAHFRDPWGQLPQVKR